MRSFWVFFDLMKDYYLDLHGAIAVHLRDRSVVTIALFKRLVLWRIRYVEVFRPSVDDSCPSEWNRRMLGSMKAAA